ncbi:hypothetical protein LINGRAHAP2_LOCUS374, partial [Linum grandiflorum]
KSQKPVPSFFHTYVDVVPGASSSSLPNEHPSSHSLSLQPISEVPICDELQDMDIEDRKRPRDLTMEPVYGPSKKIKMQDIPLQESDFPEGVLDLEPLSSDEVEEFAAELAAELATPSAEVSQNLNPTFHPSSESTAEVKEARPKRPRKPK